LDHNLYWKNQITEVKDWKNIRIKK
jgi:hypothetical protein